MDDISTEAYFLSNIGKNGWLKVNVIGLGNKFLCYGTKVSKVRAYKKFECVKILDGPFRDFFSKISLNDISYFKKLPKNYKEKSASIVYYSTKGRIVITGLGLFSTIKSKVIFPRGTYFLEIPSHPHIKTPISYLDSKNGGSKFAETWFRIVPSDSNKSNIFFHFGKLSEGCITVNQFNSWDKIYYHIIRCRSNRLNIGTIEIK